MSPPGPLFGAGTSVNLTHYVTLPPYINNNESVSIEWYKRRDLLIFEPLALPENRHSVVITISRVQYGSDYNRYTSTLTISPLADEDDGFYEFNRTVTGGADSRTGADYFLINVTGKLITT